MSLERYRAIVLEQQRQVDRIVQRAGVRPLQQIYEEILRGLTTALEALPPGYEAAIKTSMLAQARLAMSRFIAAGGTALNAAAASAMGDAARQAFETLATMEITFTGAALSLPIREIARLRGLTATATQPSSLLRAHRMSLARYGAHVVTSLEEQIATGLALGETTNKLIDRVQGVATDEWWQAERIVRTEVAHAYNVSHREAIEVEAEVFDGDVWAQWSENCDERGAPLDDRVAVDSIAMHGQVAPSGGVFTMPPTAPFPDAKGRTQVPERLAGRTWTAPPNRPNDRSTLTPWRPHWRIPGWVWRDGQRVPAGGSGAPAAPAAARPAEVRSTPPPAASPPPRPSPRPAAAQVASSAAPAAAVKLEDAAPASRPAPAPRPPAPKLVPVPQVDLPPPPPSEWADPKRRADQLKATLADLGTGEPLKDWKNIERRDPAHRSTDIAAGAQFSPRGFHTYRNAFTSKLTDEEIDAALFYSFQGDEMLNAGAREGWLAKDRKLLTMAKRLDAVIAKHQVAEDTIVHRGIRGTWAARFVERLKPGAVFTEPGYASTSATKTRGYQYMMRIKLPKGTTAAPIPSSFYNEDEMLLPRGTRFRVNAIGTAGEGDQITLIEVEVLP